MLKNLFKAAKKALKNPLVQMGIGAFLPGMLPASMGFLRNPAILQGGIGLLSGDKPENVLRNVGMSALLGGIGGMGKDGPGFIEGAKGTFRTPTSNQNLKDLANKSEGANYLGEGSDFRQSANQYAKGKPESFLGNLASQVTPKNVIDAATLALPFIAGALDDANEQQLDPNVIAGLNLQNYQDQLAQSKYQATGGITGFAAGGYDPTNGMNRVSYG